MEEWNLPRPCVRVVNYIWEYGLMWMCTSLVSLDDISEHLKGLGSFGLRDLVGGSLHCLVCHSRPILGEA